jgi:glycosyl-4,4'-diaponeurosporenoate acyltransferase
MSAPALPVGVPDSGWLVLSSAAFWLLASLLVGGLANRLPPSWLEESRAQAQLLSAGPAHPSPPEPGLGIRRWKRWIPDAGGALPGGVAKASLVRRDGRALERLLIETRRAELVHALLWPAGLLTALWLPQAAVLVNLGFATLFNLPCLLLQRHNRRRLRRCLARLARRNVSGR